jgi:hypothetical protein
MTFTNYLNMNNRNKMKYMKIMKYMNIVNMERGTETDKNMDIDIINRAFPECRASSIRLVWKTE